MSKGDNGVNPQEAVDKYADMVYRLALLQVKNKSDADDVFQEVFVRLVRHADKLENMEHAKAWLIKVTLNCARKHFASYWNRNVYPVDEMEEVAVEESGFEHAERDSSVMAAVRRLSPKYRSVIHLFYYEELTVGEIAKVTGIKEATVKSQLSRAREMLKDMLKGEIDL